MVYTHLVDCLHYAAFVGKQGENGELSFSEFLDDDRKRNEDIGTHCTAWYLDPQIMGEDISLEILELVYRVARFTITSDAQPKRLLTEDAWKRNIVPQS